MGQLHIKCFGMIAEVVGATYVLTDFHGDTENLKVQLCETFPRLKHLTFSIAVNKVLTTNTLLLSENDEIALLPPFSGG